jgi:hypothetical protein
MPRLLIAIIIGAVLGLTGPRYHSLGWYSLIPWGLAGLLLGYRSQRTERFVTGALYGFALCFSFMIAGYDGATPLVTRLPFFTLVGLFGASCGLLLTFIGHLIRAKRAGAAGEPTS